MSDEISIKDYLDAKFESLNSRMDRSEEAHAEHAQKTDERLDEMSSTLVRLTDTVEIHERRSTTLEEATRPLLDSYMQRRIISKYKADRRRALKAKLKGPGMIFGALAGTSLFSAWVAYAWEWIKSLFGG